MKCAMLLSLSLILCSCSVFRVKNETFALSQMVPKEEKTSEILLLQNIQQLLYEKNIDKAEEQLNGFKKLHPQTPNQDAVDFLQAWILESREQWNEAAEIYRGFIDSRYTSEQVIALSLFHLGDCYQQQGDQEKSLAAFLDAYNRSSNLPQEVALAELPLRITLSYQKIGDQNSVMEWLQTTFKGVNLLQAQIARQQPDFLAMIYYRLGEVRLGAADKENFDSQIKLLQVTQKFLLESLKYRHPVWSQKSYEKLVSHFNFYWGAIANQNPPSNSNALLAKSELRKQQMKQIQSFLPLIYSAQSYRPYENVDELSAEYMFFNYINELEKKVSTFLITDMELNPLTKEALELQSLKKMGHIIEIQSNKEELDRVPNDPNL